MTSQNYKELVQLDNKYENLVVAAFPCNQFGAQEPGSAADIKAFAGKYGAKFPLFAKIDVNGANASPFWKHLKESKSESGLMAMAGSDVKWNFAKFLVGKDGKTIERYAPTTSPLGIEADIVKAL